MRIWTRTALAVLLLTAFSGSSWATCVGDMSLEPQMPCCSGGHQQCPMHDTASMSCCARSVSTQTAPAATLIKAVSIQKPGHHAIDFIAALAVANSTPTLRRSLQSSPPLKTLRSPAFILNSSLLI